MSDGSFGRVLGFSNDGGGEENMASGTYCFVVMMLGSLVNESFADYGNKDGHRRARCPLVTVYIFRSVVLVRPRQYSSSIHVEPAKVPKLRTILRRTV